MNQLEDLVRRVQASVANVYILSLVSEDLLHLDNDYVPVNEYIAWVLRQKNVQVSFSLGGGLQFPTPASENAFRKLTRYGNLTPEQEKELERIGAMDSPTPWPQDPNEVMMLIDTAFSEARRSGLSIGISIDFAENLFPDGEISALSLADRRMIASISRWSLDARLAASQSVIILITRSLNDIHGSLRSTGSTVQTVKFPLPDFESRQAFANYLLAKEGNSRLNGSMTPENLAVLTGGLTLLQMDTLLRLSQSRDQSVNPDQVKSLKKEIIEQEFAGMMEVLEPRYGLEQIGGMIPIKTFFREIVQALKQGKQNLVPMGITLMGPPGTGKSALVEALAYESGFAFVRLSNIREKWVGQSERNFSRILQTLRSMTPVVVLEDEADQSEQSRDEYSGDSGVGNRIRQMRFEFTGDPSIRGKVLWIRVTNRPDKLDIAEKRSGRSSERIPLCLPTREEKTVIFSVMPKKHGFTTCIEDFAPVVKTLEEAHGEGLTGADIEEISLRAYRHAQWANRDVLNQEDYAWAINDFIPLYHGEIMRQMEQMAIKECSSRRFLPGNR